jgi:hypothetical protein
VRLKKETVMIVELGDVISETKALINIPPLIDAQFLRPWWAV